MSTVVLLRGVNVGGHKTFRPSVLAKDLSRFDVVNVGAAGTFIVRAKVSQATLRAELAKRLPFETEVMMCTARDFLELDALQPFAGHSARKDIVPFVSVLSKRHAVAKSFPMSVPETGQWYVQVIGQQDRFVFGIYRREMKAIGYLGQLDRIFGVPVTTRNWNTMSSIVRLLRQPAGA
jgi:uncharacterized protein (DUF1697 family)